MGAEKKLDESMFSICHVKDRVGSEVFVERWLFSWALNKIWTSDVFVPKSQMLLRSFI